jgi:hypothetical protein
MILALQIELMDILSLRLAPRAQELNDEFRFGR